MAGLFGQIVRVIRIAFSIVAVSTAHHSYQLSSQKSSQCTDKSPIFKSYLKVFNIYIRPCVNIFHFHYQNWLMSQNLLSITPYSNKFFDEAIQTFYTVLQKEDLSNVQIQFKYAQLRSFMSFYNEKDFKDLTPAVKSRIEALTAAQTSAYINNLKTLSSQNVLYLNPLGKGTYYVTAGFDQKNYKKFYHIKNLFKKMSDYNKSVNYRPKPIVSQPHNIYNQLSLNNESYRLKITEENELRLDLFVRGSAPQRLQGRYSYTAKEGWVKTVKEPLAPQMDYMLAEHFFRMAINKEVQNKVPAEDLKQIAGIFKGTAKAFDIRLKCAMRVDKGDRYEISMSEIYNINDVKVCKEVGEMMMNDETVLNAYIRKMFINFYSCIESERDTLTYEIELELSKRTNVELKRLIMEGKYADARYLIQNAMGQLYAIFYADHTTKIKEMSWMNHMVPDRLKEGRLDNQYGSYMRERLYRLMSGIPGQ